MTISRSPLVAIAAFLVGMASFAYSGAANDGSVTATPSGGLVFEKNNDVRMMSEDLRISLDQIDVRYSFKNISKHDVSITVGFPLPGENVLVYSYGNALHEQDFDVWVNGAKIDSKVNVRAYKTSRVNGRDVELDITQEFNALGLDPLDNNIGNKETAQRLRDLGVVCVGGDSDSEEIGCWHVQKTFYWQQTFPAGKEVLIRHAYGPWGGGSFYADPEAWKGKYCIDDDFLAAYRKITAKDKDFYYEREADVSYILKTGANWPGPIGNFRLQIDKGRADIISFCPIPGLKMRRSGNSFVGTAKDFLPKTDLDIYFLGGVF
jgi:hypothetical protein